MKPKVDRDLCIGCGACQSLCPEVGKSTEHEGADYKANKECIQKSIENCPVQAISMVE